MPSWLTTTQSRYSADLLQQWRRLSEEAAQLDLETLSHDKNANPLADTDLIRFYAQCFERPAFQDHFRQEGSMEAFDHAIEDTITAINTGCLRARDGGVLAVSKGKAFLGRTDWRRRMDLIVDLLRAIRSRFDDAVEVGAILVSDHPSGDKFYVINDPAVAEWMDETRNQVLEVFGVIYSEAGFDGPVPLLRRPTRFW